MTTVRLTFSGLRDSHVAGAPSAVVFGSRVQAREREMPAPDLGAVEGAEGEGESPREQSSLCRGGADMVLGTPYFRPENGRLPRPPPPPVDYTENA